MLSPLKRNTLSDISSLLASPIVWIILGCPFATSLTLTSFALNHPTTSSLVIFPFCPDSHSSMPDHLYSSCLNSPLFAQTLISALNACGGPVLGGLLSRKRVMAE